MTEHHKISLAFNAAMATFIVFGLVGCIGLFNTARWYYDHLDFMAASPLPPSFYISAGRLAAQFLASAVGLGFLLVAGWSRARFVCLVAVAILLLVHFSGWPTAHRTAAATDSLILVHGVRTVIAFWLAFAFTRLVPNNAFKPKPLRDQD